MRQTFFNELHKLMKNEQQVWALTGDLGWGGFDNIQKDYPERFLNCGASEQAMMGIAVGLSQNARIPFVYSITPFLIYRPFETIRNYVNYEKAHVILVGSGRDKDYLHDGYSHWAENLQTIMLQFENIKSYFPNDKKEIHSIVREAFGRNGASFISLKR